MTMTQATDDETVFLAAKQTFGKGCRRFAIDLMEETG